MTRAEAIERAKEDVLEKAAKAGHESSGLYHIQRYNAARAGYQAAYDAALIAGLRIAVKIVQDSPGYVMEGDKFHDPVIDAIHAEITRLKGAK